jgi:hypothetical protein
MVCEASPVHSGPLLAPKATLQHKKCNVREDCGTFHTFAMASRMFVAE